MPLKPLLPPLRPDTSLPGVEAAGEWTGGDIGLLQHLSRGLKRGKLDNHSANIVSIPDVWAQPEVFRTGLFNNNSALHERCRSEWRGLLALFALAQSTHLYQLAVSPIELEGSAGLLPMLNRLAPSASLNKGGRWRHIGLITVDEHCVGMLVPSTLVCSSRTPLMQPDSKVPWLINGRLTDPTCPKVALSDDDLRLLVRFCDGLRENYHPARMTLHDPTLLNALIREIGAFHASAVAALTARGQSMDGATLTPVALALPIPEKLYQPLRNTARVERGQNDEYDSVIRLREDLKSPYQGIVLHDPRITALLGKPSTEVRVWRGISLDRMEKPQLRERTVQEITAARYLYVWWELLFTTKLCRIRSPDPKLRITTHADLEHFLLPFSPLALMILKPDELLRKATITEQAGGAYSVSLTVTLHSSDSAEPISHTLEKTYAEKDVVLSEIPSGLSLWPNFQSPEWQRYFVFYSGALNLSFAIRTLLSGQSLSAFLEQERSPEEERNLPAALLQLAELSCAEDLRFRSSGDVLGELYQSTVAPEAVYCDRVVGKDKQNRYVERRERTPVGLLLLPRRQSVRPTRPTHPWSIGIDFGTTKTTVYRCSGADRGSVRPLQFANRIVSPFNAGELSHHAHRDFIPQTAAPVPFMTALRIRSPEAWKTMAPVWSCFIYYIDNFPAVVGDLISDELRSLKLDLKWSVAPVPGIDRPNTVLIQLYLEQVVLQAAAEAFDKQIALEQIHWTFSYPEAFRPEQHRQFQIAAQRAVERAGQVPSPARRAVIQPESLVAARYFQEALSVGTLDPLITLDIGGQTTDITLWRQNKLIWRGSLRLAGRHMLIDLLVAHPGILKEILAVSRMPQKAMPAYESSIAGLGEVEPDIRGFAIEILMGNTDFGERFLRDLHLISQSPQIRLLEQVAILGLVGVLYYVALLMKPPPGQSGARTRSVPAPHVSVCLGGRVSSLFAHLFPHGPRMEQLSKLLEEAGDGGIPHPNIQFSKHPKHEVAYGLVVPNSRQVGAEDGRQLGLIVGETISIDNRAYEPDAEIETLREHISPETPWQITDLPTLREMLRLLRKHLRIEVDWAPSPGDHLISQINVRLSRAIDELQPDLPEADALSNAVKRESTELEPAYIVALRELMRSVIAGECTIREAR